MRRAKKTAWTRERLLDAVLHAKMKPEQAEDLAKQAGLPPLAPQPNPADYDAMREAWWSLPMTIAWIAWRSHAEVIEVWDSYRLERSDWHYRKRILDPRTGDAHEGYLLERKHCPPQFHDWSFPKAIAMKAIAACMEPYRPT